MKVRVRVGGGWATTLSSDLLTFQNCSVIPPAIQLFGIFTLFKPSLIIKLKMASQAGPVQENAPPQEPIMSPRERALQDFRTKYKAHREAEQRLKDGKCLTVQPN